MSFSRRDSPWANSALVVTIAPDDPLLIPYQKTHGVMAGIAFQQDMERRAALMGTRVHTTTNSRDRHDEEDLDGGATDPAVRRRGWLTVPVQRVTDFLEGRISETIPSSSYRLGVQSAPCHELYPPALTTALRHALVDYFNHTLPGFVCDEALLHGVETRTSSPVRIARDADTLQAVDMQGLFPAGEGAGFAGGIVSAAVDGLLVARAIVEGQQPASSDRKKNEEDRSRKHKRPNDFYY